MKKSNQAVFDIIEKNCDEYGISKDKMINYVRKAYEEVYELHEDADAELDFVIDINKAIFEVRKKMRVVSDNDSDFSRFTEVRISNAKKYDRKVKVGEEAFLPAPIENKTKFGIFLQGKIKEYLEEERSQKLAATYEKKIDHLVSGHVTIIKPGKVYVDLGNTVAVIEREEQIPGERLSINQPIRALIIGYTLNKSKFELKLSRKSSKFIEKLFESDIEEVEDGLVRIVNIIRRPGSHTIVIVKADEPSINPTTACIGRSGSRIIGIRQLVNNESIDIAEYSPNIEEQFLNIYQNADYIDSVYYNGKQRVMNVLIKDWDEHIGKIYGARKAKINNAMNACNLFDVRLFDINQHTKDEIIKLINTTKELKDVEIIIEDKKEQIQIDKEKEIVSEIKEKEKIDEPKKEEKVILAKKKKKEAKPKEVVEIETVKRKVKQKDTRKKYIEDLTKNLDIKKINIIEEEIEEEKDDDYDYDDSYDDYDYDDYDDYED